MLTGPCKVEMLIDRTNVCFVNSVPMFFPLGLAPDTRINSARTSLKVCNLRNSSAR